MLLNRDKPGLMSHLARVGTVPYKFLVDIFKYFPVL